MADGYEKEPSLRETRRGLARVAAFAQAAVLTALAVSLARTGGLSPLPAAAVGFGTGALSLAALRGIAAWEDRSVSARERRY